MYNISSFRFFRFSMSLHEPLGFCLINIAEMYSPLWQYGTFAGVLWLLSLLVMGLLLLTTGQLFFFSVLFLNNADNSTKFLLQVSYLSLTLHNKSPYLLKPQANLYFLFIMVIISDLNSVNLVLIKVDIELIKSSFCEFWGFYIWEWVDRGYLFCLFCFHWRESNTWFLHARFWFFHKSCCKLMNYQ